MYLKRLEVYGFKSFAQKTVFEFEKGITCVIGPNGTGKSNLVEAITWVLGSQNPRDLRGNKMEDIIFNGSDNRKPLGYTYVSIILDNSDRQIDIDYSEISITRKYYRSGDSEFYINNSECRLRDIIELFTDTGLGKNGYSIIGQGKIDEILNSSPDEKRGFFEEAAGIMKYKNKRNESIKKLEVTQDNLNRLNDIISEIHTRLVPLYQESVKAHEFEDLSKKYKSYRVNDSLINYKMFHDKADIISKDIKNAKDQFVILKKNISCYEEKMQQLNKLIERLKSDEESARTCLYSNQNLLEKSKGKINLLNLQLMSDKKELKKNKQNIHESIDDARNYKSEMDKLIFKMKDLDKKSGMIDTNEKKYTNNIMLLESVTDSINSFSDKLRMKNGDLEKEILIKNNEIKHLNIDISDKLNALHECKTNYNNQISLMQSIKENATKVLKERKTVNREIKQAKDSLIQLEICSEDDKHKHAGYTGQADNYKKNMQILNTRKKVLDDMKRNYDGLNGGSKFLLKLKDKNIYGFVGGLIGLDRKYERAIETALGGSIEYLIVKSEDDAKRLIAMLKTKKAGRATFIPLSSIRPRPYKNISGNGYLGRAAELVNYNNMFKNAIEFLLGNIYVFDTIDNAIGVCKSYRYLIRAVTLDGERVSPGGLISGGFHKKSYSFFARENEITRLKTEVEKYSLNLKNVNKQITEINNNMEIQQSQADDFKNKLVTLSYRKKTIDNKLKNLFSSHKKCKSSIRELAGHIGSYKDETVKLKRDCETLEKNVDEDDYQLKQLNLLINNFGLITHELKDSYSKLIESHENFKINNAAAIAEKQSLIHRREELSGKLNSVYIDIRTLLNDRSNLRQNIGDNSKIIADEMSKRKELMHLISAANEKINEVKQKIQSEDNRKNQVTRRYKAMHDEILSVNDSLKECEIKKERILSEVNNILSRLKDEFDLTINEAFTYEDKSISEADLQREIRTLKRKLDLLGNVNMNAIKEYEETKKRYDFLTNQYRDTYESKNSLLKIITDTDKIIYNRFNVFLKQANTAFHDNFIKLFNGGQAKIELSDKANPTESGIDIIVQPPGKRLQSMSLLSGGERALVAIALLFSLLELNHPPFVILDEIDSALDDANIDRFINFLGQLSGDIQFILITHRPGTAQAANAIYGITMEEKGITKKISIKFDEVSDWR